MDSDITTGIVIPIVSLDYLNGCLDSIQKADFPSTAKICIVNDGVNSLRSTLIACYGKEDWIDLVQLEENHCFAGANNAGWSYLLQKYPEIKYLGSLNSDTVVRKNWLQPMIEILENHADVGMVGPIMETMVKKFGIIPIKKRNAIWKLGDWKNPMISEKSSIKNDSETELLGGFCFLARMESLLEVGMFTEDYRNSCEDVDLSLKMRRAGYRLMVSSRSGVFHFAGSFRYQPDMKTDLDQSHQFLREKWHL